MQGLSIQGSNSALRSSKSSSTSGGTKHVGNKKAGVGVRMMKIAKSGDTRIEFGESKTTRSVPVSRQTQDVESKMAIMNVNEFEDEGKVESSSKTDLKARKPPKAIKLWRPTSWSPEVEEVFRLQCVGWKDIYEYIQVYGEPDRWENSGYIKCLRVKKTGYYTYWSESRECEDKHVNRVKMYEYETNSTKK